MKLLERKNEDLRDEIAIRDETIKQLNTAHRWYPDFVHLLRLEHLAKQIGISTIEFAELIKGRIVNFTGRLFSSEHNRWFVTDNTPLQILRDNDKRLTLTANRIPLSHGLASNTTNSDNQSVSLHSQRKAEE